METKLIELGVSPTDATEAAARRVAYFICTGLRSGMSENDVSNAVLALIPSTDDLSKGSSTVLEAQFYCLDTVNTGR